MLTKSRLVILGVVMTVAGEAYANANVTAPVGAASALPTEAVHNGVGPFIHSADRAVSLFGNGADQLRFESMASVDSLFSIAARQDASLDSIANYRMSVPGDSDSGLMLLAAAGLIVLQLRRKQKTLPQRPLI